MTTILDVSLAVVVWAYTITRVPAVHRERQNRRAVTTWLFALLFALGLTFRIPAVRLVVDRATGIPNLTWWLSYAPFSIGLYVEACGCRRMIHAAVPRWMHGYALATQVVLAVVFFTGIAASPECLDYSIGRNLYDVAFMNTQYTCVAVMSLVIASAYVTLRRGEENALARLRMACVAFVASGGVVYGASRVSLVTIAHVSPAWPGLSILGALEKGAMVATCAGWPVIAALSGRGYLLLTKPFAAVGRALTIRDLRAVQAELGALRLWRTPDTLSLSWGSLNFRIYRAMIAILDGKRRLLTRLAATEARGRDVQWDAPTLQRARALGQMLMQAGDDAGYHDLVSYYRSVGKQMRRKQWSGT